MSWHRVYTSLALIAGVVVTDHATLQPSALGFTPHTIGTGLRGGYQVVVADLNRDDKPDIIAVATGLEELVWYENPNWQRHVIATGINAGINAATADVDGDGIPEIALAHEFSNVYGESLGSVSILTHQDDPTRPWSIREIDRVPTSHRLRFVDIDGTGRKVLVNFPLIGPKAVEPDYRDHVSLLMYRPGEWKREVITDGEEGVVHGILATNWDGDRRDSLLSASFRGVHLLRFDANRWQRTPVVAGDPAGWPKSGASEVALGHLGRERFLATIEPWHGNQVVVYRQGSTGWTRHVIDETITDGHTLVTADFDGDGQDELVVGERQGQRTAYVYRVTNAGENTWSKQSLDDGDMAAAGCAVADLNADRRLDIVCIGTSTANLKWYENRAPRDRQVSGIVFVDANANGVRDNGERGLAGVAVSNQDAVVVTDAEGGYRIAPSPTGVIFVSVPDGYRAVGTFWQPVTDATTAAPFALAPVPQTTTFSFIHASDTHVSPAVAARMQRFRTLADVLNPAFVLITGDLVRDALRVGDAEATGYYELFGRESDQFKAPVWTVPGNHENFGIEVDQSHVSPTHPLFGRGMYRHYRGPDYYSFTYGGVHFVGLNTVDIDDQWYYGHVDSLQLVWLERDLALIPPTMPVVTFNHIPFFSASEPLGGYQDGGPAPTLITVNGKTMFRHTVSNAADVLAVLRTHPLVLALGGHIHASEHIAYEISGVKTRFNQTSAIVGNGRGAGLEFRSGFTVYTVRDGVIDDGRFVPLGLDGAKEITARAARRPAEVPRTSWR